jgi:Tfp pilus assembly protein PilO
MKAKQFFFVLLGLLALSIVGIVGAYRWGSIQLEAKANTISDLQADNDISAEKIIKLQKAQQDSNNIEEVSALLDRLLPKQKEQEKLVADIIYTATAEAGIPASKVTSFTFIGSGEPDTLSGTTVSATNPGVYEYPFSLQITGISYDTLLKLLKEIETNGRIVQVDNIQISPGDSSSDLSVNLSAKAYVKP